MGVRSRKEAGDKQVEGATQRCVGDRPWMGVALMQDKPGSGDRSRLGGKVALFEKDDMRSVELPESCEGVTQFEDEEHVPQ